MEGPLFEWSVVWEYDSILQAVVCWKTFNRQDTLSVCLSHLVAIPLSFSHHCVRVMWQMG